MTQITVDQLKYGYINGVFPMADEDDGDIYWYAPDPRAIIPIDTYKPPKSLRPYINQNVFDIRINTNFEEVMKQCAKPRNQNDGVWISDDMIKAYLGLHLEGFAHSVEAWQNDKLVGGLYGVAFGSAFFGESMYYKVNNASKVAFHYLMLILRKQGYTLLDTQFINDNVKRYGAIEIARKDYMDLLDKALSHHRSFANTSK